MQLVQLTMVYERATKGTHVFIETGDPKDHKIGKLYIKKSALPPVPPMKITVCVKDANENA